MTRGYAESVLKDGLISGDKQGIRLGYPEQLNLGRIMDMKDFKPPEPKSIAYWIEYFLTEYLPSISKQQSDDIAHILTWTDEIKSAFYFAKIIFEDPKNRAKKRKKSKVIELDEKGLIGCLNDTNVTSENYKEAIGKKKKKFKNK